MVIKALNAIVTDSAMCAPWRSIDAASHAILDLEIMAAKNEIMMPRRELLST
jgi:hypothetical protein